LLLLTLLKLIDYSQRINVEKISYMATSTIKATITDGNHIVNLKSFGKNLIF